MFLCQINLPAVHLDKKDAFHLTKLNLQIFFKNKKEKPYN